MKTIAKQVGGKTLECSLANVGIVAIQHIARQLQRTARGQERVIKMVTGFMNRLDALSEHSDLDQDLDAYEEEYDKLEAKVEKFEDKLETLDHKMSNLLDETVTKYCKRIFIDNVEIPVDDWKTTLNLEMKMSIINSLVEMQGIATEEEIANFPVT